MAWVKLDDTFYDSLKIRRLARRLGSTVNEASGLLARVWSYSVRHCPDGDLSRLDSTDFAELFDSGPNIRVELEVSGFLDTLDDGRVVIHNWGSRAGSYSDNARAKRYRKSRASEQRHVTVTQQARDGHVSVTPRKKERKKEREKEKQEKEKAGSSRVEQVEAAEHVKAIYAAWRARHPRAAQSLCSTRSEYRQIKARVESLGVETCLAAVDGCHNSPYNCGENKSRRKYQSLELIFRNDSKTVQFAEMAGTSTPPPDESQRLYDKCVMLAQSLPREIIDKVLAKAGVSRDAIKPAAAVAVLSQVAGLLALASENRL